jgi:chloramphenicol 3-O phosphotransferase
LVRIILLNGVGSVGKTSLARAIQEAARTPFLHVAMDVFLDMLPSRYADHPQSFEYLRIEASTVKIKAGPLGERLLRGMRDSIAALAATGADLIVDDVLNAEDVADYRRILSDVDLKLVGLVAPRELIELRERTRGDRMIGLAAGQLGYMHKGIAYDLMLDTSTAPPADLARQVCEAFGL